MSVCLARWKIPGALWNFSNPFCIGCCKSWKHWCLLRQKCKRFKAEKRADHAVGPPRPIHCSGNPQGEDFVKHHQAWTINEYKTADPHLETNLERSSEKKMVVNSPNERRWKKAAPLNSVSGNTCTEINPSAYNDVYIRRTAQLTTRRCFLNIYSTNTLIEYFKHAAQSPFFFPPFKMPFIS